MTTRNRRDVRFFASFEDENAAEHRRRPNMTPQERLEEFAALQERRWGSSWTSVPMVKKATWERVSWQGPIMLLSDDMRELLGLFRAFEVRHLVVGDFAVNYCGSVRTTQDIDVVVDPTSENAGRVMRALAEFGFGGAGIPQELFEREGGVVHLGVEPNRIDMLTGLKGVGSDALFAGARVVEIDGEKVNLISLEHLIAVKRTSDRPRDRADADELVKIRESRSEG